jgi:hypothetical protein
MRHAATIKVLTVYTSTTAERCSDRVYIETHLARMSLADLPPSEIDGVKRACAIQ